MTFIHTTPWAYYNDFDEKTCDWLEELIRRDAIAPGIVDRRSILEVQPDDLREFRQVHFFAGLGGWSYALRLMGWPDDEHVWSGSTPCQPFSSAGRQKGKEDERHLAPKFASLVWACRPRLLFGEQVASAEVFGKAPKKSRRGAAEPPQWAWLDDLLDRLEAAHYAVGANDLPSASIGAPHIRQRTHFGAVNLEWLADAQRGERGPGGLLGLRQADGSEGERKAAELAGSRDGRWLADSDHKLQESTGDRTGLGNTRWSQQSEWLADRLGARLEGHRRHGDNRGEPGWVGTDAPRSASARSDFGGLADAHSGESGQRGRTRGSEGEGVQRGTGTNGRGMSCRLGDPRGAAGERNPGTLLGKEAGKYGARFSVDGDLPVAPEHAGSGLRGLADTDGRDAGAERLQRGGEQRQQPQDCGAVRLADAEHHDGRADLAQRGPQGRTSDAWGSTALSVDDRGWAGTADSPWGTADWLFCRDGKWRPVEASAQQMVDGIPVDLGRGGDPGGDAHRLAQEEIGFPLGKVQYARATRLRGYGNAINPHLAAEFICAFLDALRGCADELSGESPLEGLTVRQRDLEDLL